MAQAVAIKQKVQDMRSFLDKQKGQLAAALPKHLTPDRMNRLILTSCLRNPRLFDCTPESMAGAILSAASCGLEIDDARGQGYLVPFKNNKKGGIYEAVFIPGYRGLSDLATRSGRVMCVLPYIVYAADEFDYTVETGIHHRPNLDVEDRGAVRFFYALARMNDGQAIFSPEPWPLSKVLQHRKNFSRRSGGGDSINMSDEDYGKKTVIRELCKYLPSSPELQRAIAVDERVERGELDVTGILDTDVAAIDTDDKPAADKKLEAISGGKEKPALLSDPQKTAIRNAIKAADIDEDALNRYLKMNYKADSLDEVPAEHFEDLADWAKAQKRE